jgi:hypothetical protein
MSLFKFKYTNNIEQQKIQLQYFTSELCFYLKFVETFKPSLHELYKTNAYSSACFISEINQTISRKFGTANLHRKLSS